MVYDTIYIYFRIAKLITIIFCEFIKFNNKKCINYLFNNPTQRLDLIKNISKKLEKENIVYVKIFQALCLDKDLVNSDEQDFLLKYTDNVPYKSIEIDYELLDKLETEFSITLKSKIPINCGMVGVVFEGSDSSNNKVIIKMLKKNILKKFTNVFNELLYISYVCQYIPYIKSLKITKILLDNEQILLNQMDFIREVEAIEIFTKKYKNNKEYVFPKVYRHITEKYNNLLVMENISGLKFQDIENMSETIKEEFAYLINKFGMLGILYHSVVHCDLHSGNVFFYINDEPSSTNNDVPKYKLGIIDFGICCFPNKENQNAYYIFLNDILQHQNYTNVEKLLYAITDNKEALNNLNPSKKQEFINENIKYFKINTTTEISIKIITDLSKVFYKYNLNLTEEFNKFIISVPTANTFAKQLSKNLYVTRSRVITNLNKLSELLEI
jgi:predicted unusual protein kinase regulating ubiquinone biosynthesis (AarF/ABC1/UbiB family)